MKKVDYRHIICAVITLAFLAVGIFRFFDCIGRLAESGRDLGISVTYYFSELFQIPHSITPTVNEYPNSDFIDNPFGNFAPSVSLPESWEGFKVKWGEYWQVFATGENVSGYFSFLGNSLYIFCIVIFVAIPLVLILVLVLRKLLRQENNDYGKDTKPLKVFKLISKYTYCPAKARLISFFGFVREHKAYWIIWLCLWGLYFNLFTILLEFIAFYLYFAVSFDFASIYRQVYKLVYDLWVPFNFLPLWAWVILTLFLINLWRRKIGYARLRHNEMKNRGFINARPIVSMTCGTMGKKKTTMITDMALSMEVMLKDKAFEKLLEEDLKFPYFPWINLENALRTVMEYHHVYNLATVKAYIHKKHARFVKTPCLEKIFGYDYERYGTSYDDKQKITDIWEVLETYAKLYFIYVIQSSLIISNYSVRTDTLINDIGNFPLWNTDFFERDSRLIDSFSRHSHIIDFDALRLGKKVIENNPLADSFEFGVILITEVGKERKNALELKEIKASVKESNQKNDGFNDWLKMIRHSATVANYPFVKVITDEQRPESWGADARDLCEIVHIKESGEPRLAMPFFFIAELLYSFILGRFVNAYYKYRYMRGDNTLSMLILKTFAAKIQHYYTGVYNTFGYCTLTVQVESGTQDGELTVHKYYLANKKIYAKRFSTDCFSDFFTEKALHSPVGIDDLREYVTEKATVGELQRQNSYFVRDMVRDFKKDSED